MNLAIGKGGPSPELSSAFTNLFAERLDPMQKEAPYTALHLRWYLNVALLVGNQRLRYDDQRQTLAPEEAPTWRSRYTANLVFSKVQRALSKLTGEDAAARVSPASPDRDDVVKAKNAEQLLDYLRDVSDFSSERDMAILWAIVTGTGAIKTWFDFDAGEKRVIVKDDGTKMPPEAIGDVRCQVASPFGLRIPVYSEREDELPWLAWTCYRDINYAKARFPWIADHITPIDPASDLDWTSELRIRTLLINGVVASEPSRERVCRITELFVAPTYGLPNGAHGVKVNDLVGWVSTEKNGGKIANPFMEIGCPIPFSYYRYAKVPGRFWGMSLVELLDQMQREYNQTRGDTVENIRLTGRPKILSPKGGLVIRNSWTSQPGEVVEYNASLPPPQVVTPAPLPPGVEEHAARCLMEMNEVSGQAEVSEGKAPASVRSGVAIQLLQTAALETLGHARKCIAKADRDVYKKQLAFARRFYTEDRNIAIEGQGRQFQVLRLSGANLASPEAVRIFAESGLFESKAARTQNLLDVAQLGGFNLADPAERLSFLEAIEMGDAAPYLSEQTIDQRQADEENAIFEELGKVGKLPAPPEPRDFEDHVVHIKRHNLFRKGDAYRGLDPASQQIIDQHVAAHQAFLAQMIAAQQQDAASKRGGPGEKGTPSPPGSGKSGQAADGGGANGADG